MRWLILRKSFGTNIDTRGRGRIVETGTCGKTNGAYGDLFFIGQGMARYSICRLVFHKASCQGADWRGGCLHIMHTFNYRPSTGYRTLKKLKAFISILT